MSLKGFVAGTGLFVVLFAVAPALRAQDEAPAVADDEQGKGKRPFALFVEAGGGMASPEDLTSSIATLSSHKTDTILSFDDQLYARASIGWKLPHDKGDFRLTFNGYAEDGYSLRSTGVQAAIDPAGGSPGVAGPLLWWVLTIEDGVLTSSRTPPQWIPSFDANNNGICDPGEENDDANCNGIVDLDEVRYVGADVSVTRNVASDLQNRAQTWDATYGRKFGSRRYTARWVAGLRHFRYDGSVPATAWLSAATTGEGFTDGAFLRPIIFRQETSGFGPTGGLEAQMNFANDRLQLFLGGQVAFLVLDVATDSGAFVTIVPVSSGGSDPATVGADARLTQSLKKSSWQNTADAGARVRLRNGVGLEVGYGITGFLDSVLTPNTIRIPENSGEAPQGTSATFSTQDLVFTRWYGSVSFQF